MKLHLGCGYKKLEGFINVDIRPETNCDIIDDVTNLKSFNDNSADMIYACHVLEHFGRHSYKDVLKRWTTVLKSGGTLRISVPDLLKVSELHYNKKYPLKKLIGFLYGGQNYAENYHYIGFDFDMLKEDLEELGYKDVKMWNWKEVEHGSVDDYSQAYLPHMDKENGDLMSLNIECTKK
jgi:predicted SAM-dependent methyltransferase